MDGSDEQGCGASTCAPHEFSCYSGSHCILGLYVCDDDPDCPDGSDERNCGEPAGVISEPGAPTLGPAAVEGMTSNGSAMSRPATAEESGADRDHTDIPRNTTGGDLPRLETGENSHSSSLCVPVPRRGLILLLNAIYLALTL